MNTAVAPFSETALLRSSSGKTVLGTPAWSLSVTTTLSAAHSSSSPHHSSSWAKCVGRLHISRPSCRPVCVLDARVTSGAEITLHCSSREGTGLELSPCAQPASTSSREHMLGPIITPGTVPQSISEWELDFFSRPILDDHGKRMWELIVCDSGRSLQFARFYPNNAVNSLVLKDAILHIMRSTGLSKPQKIRFFRSQVQPIISKICNQLDIQPVPSRRCVSLMRWLDERYNSVYRQHPRFQMDAMPPLQLEQSFPLELSDALRGEQWAFVQLPLLGVIEEVAEVKKGTTFGSYFSLENLNLGFSSNAVIPGLAVASARATPLAAWTNTLELASLQIDRRKGCVVLATGIMDRWLYAFYRKSGEAEREAEAWLAAKKACQGLHFLAVQKSLDSDVCTGFWLLFDQPLPQV